MSNLRFLNFLQYLPRFYCSLVCGILILSLSACLGQKQTLIWDTFKAGIQGNKALVDNAVLNPRYRYLRVDMNGQPALLVLGYEDKRDGDTTQTWYTGNKEVLQLQNGRLVGTEGLDVNWVNVSVIDAPSITSPELFPNELTGSKTTKRNPKLFFFRTRSVMPQYQINIHEAIAMQGLKEMPQDVPKILRDPGLNVNLKWVEETVVLVSNNPTIRPLRAIYAYDRNTRAIVFGRQCLNTKDCLSWLVWPYPNSVSSSQKPSLEPIQDIASPVLVQENDLSN